MKCIVCGNEFDDKRYDACPACGTIAIVGLGDVDENSEAYKKMVEDLKKKFLVDYIVSICTYRWKQDTNKLPVMKERVWEKIADTKDMKPGEICWLDKQFARSFRQSVEIEFQLKDKAGNTKMKKTTIQTPTQHDFWKIGFSILEGNKGKFHILCAGMVTDSDEFSLI